MNSDPENHDAGFDQTPEGLELIALLQKHAPPAPDSRRGAEAVLQRLRTPQTAPRGNLLFLRWAGPLVGAAAVVAIAFVVLNSSPNSDHTNAPPTVAEKETPAPAVSQVVIRHDRSWPEIEAVVRGQSADGLLIDAGLKDGLRVGDVLQGPRGVQARVSAVGVFEARVSVTGGKALPGTEFRARVTSDAQKRAASFSDFGGDPGAFFEFGAVVSAMPLGEARMLGISDGAALRVDETIPALMKDAGGAARN